MSIMNTVMKSRKDLFPHFIPRIYGQITRTQRKQTWEHFVPAYYRYEDALEPKHVSFPDYVDALRLNRVCHSCEEAHDK